MPSWCCFSTGTSAMCWASSGLAHVQLSIVTLFDTLLKMLDMALVGLWATKSTLSYNQLLELYHSASAHGWIKQPSRPAILWLGFPVNSPSHLAAGGVLIATVISAHCSNALLSLLLHCVCGFPVVPLLSACPLLFTKSWPLCCFLSIWLNLSSSFSAILKS